MAFSNLDLSGTWNNDTITQVQNQIAKTDDLLMDFVSVVNIPTDNFKIPFVRGEDGILSSIPLGGSRLKNNAEKVQYISAQMGVFGLEEEITAGEIRNIAYLDQKNKISSEANIIKNKLQRFKAKMTATKTFMIMGAIKGKVLDGDENVLFENNLSPARATIRRDVGSGKFEAFELALSEKIVQEFGTSVETVTLCDMDYFANLKNDLKSQGITTNAGTGEVSFFSYKNIPSLRSALTTYVPYNRSKLSIGGGELKFLESKTAFTIPLKGAITMFQGIADNINAKNYGPYFDIKNLETDKGKRLTMDESAIAICDRPYGIIPSDCA